jgi:hypothetical protein
LEVIAQRAHSTTIRGSKQPQDHKLGLGHFRWKTSTDLRGQGGKAQKKPIHLTSWLFITAVSSKVTKTRF